MKFTTPVELPVQSLQLFPETHVLTVGSCFATHIGQRMRSCLPEGQVTVNPSGTLYNPHSILRLLQWLATPSDNPRETHFFQGQDGCWHHRMFSTEVSASTLQECRKQVAQRIRTAREAFRHVQCILVTFSTDHVFLLRDSEEECVVANCHKEPASHFEESVYPQDRTVKEWTGWMDLPGHDTGYIGQTASPIQVVFTLSPYRYAKHGMHENQLSKARLLCAIDQICRHSPHAHYFPAYEILMDELRNYRFYAPDMLHPSDTAIDYIWERFTQWAFSPQLKAYAAQRLQIERDFAHKILHPETPAAQAFREARRQRLESFQRKYGEHPSFAMEGTLEQNNN